MNSGSASPVIPYSGRIIDELIRCVESAEARIGGILRSKEASAPPLDGSHDADNAVPSRVV